MWIFKAKFLSKFFSPIHRLSDKKNREKHHINFPKCDIQLREHPVKTGRVQVSIDPSGSKEQHNATTGMKWWTLWRVHCRRSNWIWTSGATQTHRSYKPTKTQPIAWFIRLLRFPPESAQTNRRRTDSLNPEMYKDDRTKSCIRQTFYFHCSDKIFPNLEPELEQLGHVRTSK